MASIHIEIQSDASALSAKVRSLIDRLNDVVNDARDIKEIMDSVAFESDWSALAVKLGFPNDEVGWANAETVYNLFGSVSLDLQGAFIAQLTSRCG